MSVFGRIKRACLAAFGIRIHRPSVPWGRVADSLKKLAAGSSKLPMKSITLVGPMPPAYPGGPDGDTVFVGVHRDAAGRPKITRVETRSGVRVCTSHDDVADVDYDQICALLDCTFDGGPDDELFDAVLDNLIDAGILPNNLDQLTWSASYVQN